MCHHQPPCPTADAADHDAARVIADHCEQGWVLLCNGIVRFDDLGELLPDGRIVAPHRVLIGAFGHGRTTRPASPTPAPQQHARASNRGSTTR
jgi:Family of unknown function (DUF5999)